MASRTSSGSAKPLFAQVLRIVPNAQEVKWQAAHLVGVPNLCLHKYRLYHSRCTSRIRNQLTRNRHVKDSHQGLQVNFGMEFSSLTRPLALRCGTTYVQPHELKGIIGAHLDGPVGSPSHCFRELLLGSTPQDDHSSWDCVMTLWQQICGFFFLARCCLGQVPGGAPFSQRSEQATACTNRMQIRN